MKAVFPLEAVEQTAFIRWLAYHSTLQGLPFAIGNGGYRTKTEAARLKAQGVRSGVSDIFIPYPHNGKHGLFIEMKRQKGCHPRVEPAQKQWLETMRALDYGGEIAYGWEDGVKIINAYMSS